MSILERVILTDDELEAVRLADVEQLYQEQAAEKMGISRQTFGRIIESAHKKIGDALVNGKALCIEGGAVTHSPETPAAAEELCPCGKRRRRHGMHCDHD